MTQLDDTTRQQILTLLKQGNSYRNTAAQTGVTTMTVRTIGMQNGIHRPRRTLTLEQRRKVINDYAQTQSYSETARRNSIAQGTVRRILAQGPNHQPRIIDRQKVLDLVNQQNLTVDEAAAQLNASRSFIVTVLRENGGMQRAYKRRYVPEDLQQRIAREHIVDGRKLKDLADEHDLSTSTIVNICRKYRTQFE